MRARLNGGAAALAAVALLATVVVLALGSDGFEETAVDLHEAGVWVTKDRQVARFNVQIAEHELILDSQPDEDVVQTGLAVARAATSPGSLVRIDSVTGEPGEPSAVPDGAHVAMGGPTGLVVDEAEGTVWMMPADRIGSAPVVDPETAVFVAEGSRKRTVATVGLDGSVHVHQVGTTQVHSYPAGYVPGPQAAPPAVATIGRPLARPQIATVGERVVLLDQDSGRLVVVGGPVVDLSDVGADLQLQLDGPEASSVLVAGGGQLLEVPLSGGEAVVVSGDGGDGAIRPVRARGCVWAAFATGARWTRTCETGAGERSTLAPANSEPIEGLEAGGSPSLRFRVNRQRVVLNETATGLVWTVDQPRVEPVRWPVPEDDTTPIDPGDEETDEGDECGEGGAQVPTANPDSAGTRPARPVIVTVLSNDSSDECDSLTVRIRSYPEDLADVAVVRDHSAIQVTPRDGVDSGSIVVEYEAVSMQGALPSSATLTVTVRPVGENEPPTSEDDRTFTAPDQVLHHNVLVNDGDPNGDVIRLVSVDAADGSPPVEYRADGTVTYRAGGAAGVHNYTYVIEDEQGERSEPATLMVSVRDEVHAPEPRSDLVVAARGKRATVNLLANDTDADTSHDRLIVADVTGDRAGLGLRWETDGSFTVEPTADARALYRLAYQVSDRSGGNGEGTVVVRVEEDAGNRPPVAVLDSAFVRPDLPTVVNVLANDLDADGDVLAVREVVAPADDRVSVELIDLRLVRVVASGSFEPFQVRYTLTDGEWERDGTLVVLPHQDAVPNQAPTAMDDEVTVRAGRWTSVNVVANDIDPEGERLSVVGSPRVVEGEEDRGDAFVQGDHIRFRAPPGTTGSVDVSYEIADPGGRKDTGKLTVRVKPEDAANERPAAVHLEARVFAGDSVVIPVPLVGADPDGDVVSIVGVDTASPPVLGDVRRDPAGLRYRADADAVGSDSFGFTITDGRPDGENKESTVRVVVVASPGSQRRPTAVPDEITVKAGTRGRFIDVLANDTDPEGGPLTIVTEAEARPRVLAGGLGDEVTARDGQLWYTPPSSIGEPSIWVGLSYVIEDAAGLRDEGVVRVRILSADSDLEVPPVALDDAAPDLVVAGEAIVLPLTANDFDPDDADPQFVPEVDVPDGADWSVSPAGDGRVRFQTGSSSILASYTITDAAGITAQALVSIVVVDTLPPDAVLDDGYEARAGDPDGVSIPVLDNDVPRGEVRLVRVIPETFRLGTANRVGDRVVFTAEAGAEGEGGFSYLISSGEQQAVGRVRVRVVPGADDPDQAPQFLSAPRQVVQATRPGVVLDLTEFARDDRTASKDLTFTARVEDPATGLRAALPDGTSVLELSAVPDAPGGATQVNLTVADGVNPPVAGAIEVQVLPDLGPDTPVANPDPDGQMKEGTTKDFPVTNNDRLDPAYPDLLPVVKNPEVLPGTGSGVAVLACDNRCVRYTAAEGDRLVRIRYTLGDNYTRDGGSAPGGRESEGILTITVYGRPGRPGKPSGQMRSGAVQLNWDRAPENGLPVDGYLLKIEAVDGGRVPSVGPITAAEADVVGLQNGRRYRFRVAAYNREFGPDEVREQDYSEPSDEFKPDEIPGAPPSVRVVFDPARNGAGNAGGVLHVEWDEAPTGGTAIQQYEVVPSFGPSQTVNAPLREASFTGLTNGRDYTFTVRARNELDWGEFSAPSNTEHPTGVPTAPTAVSVRQDAPEHMDRAAAIVEFEHADPAGRPEDELSFSLAVSPAGGSWPESFTSGSVVTGLTPGGSYTFTVTPRNRAGPGPSASSPATKAFAKASPPAAPTALSTAEDQVTVTWSPSSDGAGGMASRYRVIRYSEIGSVLDQREVSSGTSAQFSAVADQGYTFGVVAISPNPGGDPAFDSSESPRSTQVVHYGRPQVSAAGTEVEPRTGRRTAVVWTWPTQRAVTSYVATVSGQGDIAVSCSVSTCRAVYGAGWGHPRTFSLAVTAIGPNPAYRPVASAVTSASTEDTRSVRVETGGNASGQPTIKGTPCRECTYGEAWGSGFAPGNYTITPKSNMNDDYVIAGGEYAWTDRYAHVTVGSDGSWHVGGAGRVGTYWYQGPSVSGVRASTSVWVCTGHIGRPAQCADVGAPWVQH